MTNCTEARAATLELLADIEAFIARKEISPSRFGKLVADPNIVSDIRGGRTVGDGVRRRVATYMRRQENTDLRPFSAVKVAYFDKALPDSPRERAIQENNAFIAVLLPAKLEYLARQQAA